MVTRIKIFFRKRVIKKRLKFVNLNLEQLSYYLGVEKNSDPKIGESYIEYKEEQQKLLKEQKSLA